MFTQYYTAANTQEENGGIYGYDRNSEQTFFEPLRGASYLAFGRFFNSLTKPGAPAATPEMLEQARACFALPLVAIGGVDLDNGAGLIARGADMLAVIHALFAADSASEVERRARAFSALFNPS